MDYMMTNTNFTANYLKIVRTITFCINIDQPLMIIEVTNLLRFIGSFIEDLDISDEDSDDERVRMTSRAE